MGAGVSLIIVYLALVANVELSKVAIVFFVEDLFRLGVWKVANRVFVVVDE